MLQHWNILVGRQPNPDISLRTDLGWEVSGEDVQIWLEERGENTFALSAYCQKLLPMLQEEENRVWWAIVTLTDQMLGEIPHMRYIDSLDVLEAPREEPSIPLTELPHKLRELGLDLSTDPKACLESYLGYQMTPNEDRDADWRLDTIAGSTCCAPLINGYLNADNYHMDNLHADGAVAGFLCYPLCTLQEEEGSQKIFDFRDSLEEALTAGDGAEALTLIGGATGIYCGYVDFIAWDLPAALDRAETFFKNTALPWANFHTFRREAATVPLKRPEEDAADIEELEETLTGMDYIPYTPENADKFYRQLEQWNDQDEYTRCIQALNAIPEDWRDYRTAYALARALENYAIIGDHDTGAPNGKGDKALQRALQVLESVREEGQHKAEWNMRMAYGYQYLYGQEEKAIPYARRWAELDPTDENATAVIRECQEEIQKQQHSPQKDASKKDNHQKDACHKDDDASEDKEASKSDLKGVFAGFVLLSKGEWDKQQFIHDMKEKWGITVDQQNPSEDADEAASQDESQDAVVFEVGHMSATVGLMTYPVPNGEAEANAENNYMWPEAVKAAREHCAHIIVAGLGKEEDVLEKGKLYTKLVAACCRQKHATGVYTSGVVFEPRFYESAAHVLDEGELPIFNWIWFGLYRSEGGLSAYTYGMDAFGKDEMEVLDVNARFDELRDFLTVLVFYVLENDVELKDGETIGFTADDIHTITRSKGVALPEEQMTLKISYQPTDDNPEGDDDTAGMDYALCHIESIEEKGLAIDPINAYNHMAIYLRWCMEHDLMGDAFLEEYSAITEQTKARPGNTDLRTFIREELSGCLHSALFNRQGQAFAQYYYGENDQPYYPADIDDYALEYFGKARYHSDEFQEEAYLFLPFDEAYYQAMAKVIQRRFTNWQSQDFDEDTLEPSELAQAMMKYLDCECTYFPSMRDDDPIMSAYRYARRLGVREGFIPLLVKVDETLWECLVLNTDPENDGADDYAFQPEKVAKYREKMLAAPVKDGKAVLEELIGQRKEDAEDDDMDWEEVLGEMEEDAQPDTEDELNTRFASYWCERTQMTCPLILAKIPVKNPWEIFAYLPFGNWNDCPDTPELMAAAKYWFQQHGAVPAAMTHDELEFHLPAPVPGNEAMEVAVEQYGLCPDMDQNFEEIASLADTLRRSTVWYFWWD